MDPSDKSLQDTMDLYKLAYVLNPCPISRAAHFLLSGFSSVWCPGVCVRCGILNIRFTLQVHCIRA